MSEVTQEAVVAVEPKVAKAPKSKAPAKDKATKAPVKVKVGNLQEGSTRLRLFKALAKFATGLSANEIKEKTGMLPGSGHLAVLLGEEQEAKRIKSALPEPQDGERQVTIYSLTALGRKDFAADKIDTRNNQGRVGTAWTKARRKATPVTKG